MMERVKSDLYYTIESTRVGTSGVKIYKMVLKHFEDDATKADDFMLSSDGGFTKSQLHRIKYLINYHSTTYQSRKT